MLPVTAGAEATRRQILIYSIIMVPASLAPWFLGASGVLYAIGAGILSAIFVCGRRRRSRPQERRVGTLDVQVFRSLPCLPVRASRSRPGAHLEMAEDALAKRQRRRRSVTIALLLAAFILLLYVVSIVRMGG